MNAFMFYADNLYGSYDHLKDILRDPPDGAYACVKQQERWVWWHRKGYTWNPIKDQEVPKTLLTLMLVLT